MHCRPHCFGSKGWRVRISPLRPLLSSNFETCRPGKQKRRIRTAFTAPSRLVHRQRSLGKTFDGRSSVLAAPGLPRHGNRGRFAQQEDCPRWTAGAPISDAATRDKRGAPDRGIAAVAFTRGLGTPLLAGTSPDGERDAALRRMLANFSAQSLVGSRGANGQRHVLPPGSSGTVWGLPGSAPLRCWEAATQQRKMRQRCCRRMAWGSWRDRFPQRPEKLQPRRRPQPAPDRYRIERRRRPAF
jgi:hypothetical protein